jgi:hypothetical protein
MPVRAPLHKHRAPTKEVLERNKLVHDVVARLDYDDMKSIIAQEMESLEEVCLDKETEESIPYALIFESDVILTKIEKILMEFRKAEKKGSSRMRQIDISLAALEAAHEGH